MKKVLSGEELSMMRDCCKSVGEFNSEEDSGSRNSEREPSLVNDESPSFQKGWCPIIDPNNSQHTNLDSLLIQTILQRDPEVANCLLMPSTIQSFNAEIDKTAYCGQNDQKESNCDSTAATNFTDNTSLCRSKYKYRRHRSGYEENSDEEYDQLCEKSTGTIINMEKKDYEKLRPQQPTERSPETPQNIRVGFVNDHIWKAFHVHVNEMIITKAGRKIFPRIVVEVSGLRPENLYCMCVGFKRLGNIRYKFQSEGWVESGTNEFIPPGNKEFFHPASPMLGEFWMGHHIYFKKIKLTNFSKSEKSEQIQMTSLHKYEPYVKIVAANSLEEQTPENTMIFPIVYSQFMAVTAYQNEQITQLKIMNNPFAKGFRRDKNSSGKKPTNRCSNFANKHKKSATNYDSQQSKLSGAIQKESPETNSSQSFHSNTDQIGFGDASKIYKDFEFNMQQKPWNLMPGSMDFPSSLPLGTGKQEDMHLFSNYMTSNHTIKNSDLKIASTSDASCIMMDQATSNNFNLISNTSSGNYTKELGSFAISSCNPNIFNVHQSIGELTNSSFASSQNSHCSLPVNLNPQFMNNNMAFMPNGLNSNVPFFAYENMLQPMFSEAVNSNLQNNPQILNHSHYNNVTSLSLSVLNAATHPNMHLSTGSLMNAFSGEHNFYNQSLLKDSIAVPTLSSANDPISNKTFNNVNPIFSQIGATFSFASSLVDNSENGCSQMNKMIPNSISTFDYTNSTSLMDLFRNSELSKNYNQDLICKEMTGGWNEHHLNQIEQNILNNMTLNNQLTSENTIIKSENTDPNGAEMNSHLINGLSMPTTCEMEANHILQMSGSKNDTLIFQNHIGDSEINSSSTLDHGCYGSQLEDSTKISDAYFMPPHSSETSQ